VKALAPDELVARVAAGTLKDLDGIGPKTAAIITEVATSGSTAPSWGDRLTGSFAAAGPLLTY